MGCCSGKSNPKQSQSQKNQPSTNHTMTNNTQTVLFPAPSLSQIPGNGIVIPEGIQVQDYVKALTKFTDTIDLMVVDEKLPKNATAQLVRLQEASEKVNETFEQVEKYQDPQQKDRTIMKLFMKYNKPINSILVFLLHNQEFNDCYPIQREAFKEIYHNFDTLNKDFLEAQQNQGKKPLNNNNTSLRNTLVKQQQQKQQQKPSTTTNVSENKIQQKQEEESNNNNKNINKNSYSERLQEAQQEFDKKIDDIYSEYNKEIQQVQDDYNLDIQKIATHYKQVMKDQNEQAKKVSQQQYLQEIDERKLQYKNKIKEIQQQYKAVIANVQSKKDQYIVNLQLQYELSPEQKNNKQQSTDYKNSNVEPVS